MLHGIIGNPFVTTPFLRFETDSGSSLDPVFTTSGSASFQWISPDGTISTGATPSAALDQIGAYVVKCSNWSDITRLDIRTDNLIILENLHVFAATITRLDCQNNSLTVLDVSSLTAIKKIYCQGNSIASLDVPLSAVLDTFLCLNNGMSQAAVDNILAGLVATGASNGNADLSGTNAAPSAAGLTNKGLLETAGWTVTVTA